MLIPIWKLQCKFHWNRWWFKGSTRWNNGYMVYICGFLRPNSRQLMSATVSVAAVQVAEGEPKGADEWGCAAVIKTVVRGDMRAREPVLTRKKKINIGSNEVGVSFMYMARVFPLLLSLSLILSRKRATRKVLLFFFCTCRLQGKCRRKKKRQSFKLPSSMQQEHDDCSNSCAQLLVASLSASPSLTLLMSV